MFYLITSSGKGKKNEDCKKEKKNDRCRILSYQGSIITISKYFYPYQIYGFFHRETYGKSPEYVIILK